MEANVRIFQQNPELGISLALSPGITLRKIKFGHFKLGMVVGTMISGMVIGALVQLQVPGLVKWAFFDLFLFAIGYSAGPQFFRGLKKGALPQIALALAAVGILGSGVPA
jgi:putative transport protein